MNQKFTSEQLKQMAKNVMVCNPSALGPEIRDMLNFAALLVGNPEKRAPVQGFVQGIPWSMHLDAYNAYCKKYSPQPALIDLEDKNCRGGFDTEELDEFIPGWREKLSEITTLKEELSDYKLALDIAEAHIELLDKIADCLYAKLPNGEIMTPDEQYVLSRMNLQ